MSLQQRGDVAVGVLAWLLVSAALAGAFLLGALATGLDAVRDAIGGGMLHTWIQDGRAFTAALLAILALLPFVALGIAAMVGHRAAEDGRAVGRAAALSTLAGVPIAWVNLGLALIVVAAVTSRGQAAVFDDTFDLVAETGIYLLFALPVLVGLAALAAVGTRDVFRPAPGGAVAATGATWSGGDVASDVAGDAVEDEATLHDYPVDCPRCQTRFHVSGTRPVQIECPTCGKTGTIR